jgi:hypothetical protein
MIAEREAKVQRRVKMLIDDFERYVVAFDQDPAFTKSGQLGKHVATIGIRRQIGSVELAVRDTGFLMLLYETLQAWGIGLRGSRLVAFDRFARSIANCEPGLKELEEFAIDTPTLAVESVLDKLWELISRLGIVENNAKLVACSKALHHLLPELVVPIDRAFTGTFFGWHRPEFQYHQEKIFRQAYQHFVDIAKETNPSRFVGGGWRTSRTKIVDNALVGFCRAEKIPIPS